MKKIFILLAVLMIGCESKIQISSKDFGLQYFSGYQTSIQNVPDTWVGIPLHQNIKSENIKHIQGSSRVEVLFTGPYLISGSMTTDTQTPNQGSMDGVLQIDTGDGDYKNVLGTYLKTYQNNDSAATSGANSASFQTIQYLLDGTIIRFAIKKHGGSSDPVSLYNASFNIIELEQN